MTADQPAVPPALPTVAPQRHPKDIHMPRITEASRARDFMDDAPAVAPSEAQGTYKCPVCSKDTPHTHTLYEVRDESTPENKAFWDGIRSMDKGRSTPESRGGLREAIGIPESGDTAAATPPSTPSEDTARLDFLIANPDNLRVIRPVGPQMDGRNYSVWTRDRGRSDETRFADARAAIDAARAAGPKEDTDA